MIVFWDHLDVPMFWKGSVSREGMKALFPLHLSSLAVYTFSVKLFLSFILYNKLVMFTEFHGPL